MQNELMTTEYLKSYSKNISEFIKKRKLKEALK